MRSEEEIREQLKSELALRDILYQQREFTKVVQCDGAINILKWVLQEDNQ